MRVTPYFVRFTFEHCSTSFVLSSSDGDRAIIFLFRVGRVSEDMTFHLFNREILVLVILQAGHSLTFGDQLTLREQFNANSKQTNEETIFKEQKTCRLIFMFK